MKTCLVSGNGPSLRDIRNSTLDKFDTFGGNRVYLKYEPDYYVFVDPMMGKTNVAFMDEINSLKSEKFISEEWGDNIPGCVKLKCIHKMGFSDEPLKYVYTYFSVITAMIQLAVWKGYKRIGLVGVDHRYHTPRGERAWHPAFEDTNHFTDEYYKNYLGAWVAPKLDKLTEWFQYTKSVLDNDGVEVVNLTPGSGLSVFPFGKIEDWIT